MNSTDLHAVVVKGTGQSYRRWFVRIKSTKGESIGIVSFTTEEEANRTARIFNEAINYLL